MVSLYGLEGLGFRGVRGFVRVLDLLPSFADEVFDHL